MKKIRNVLSLFDGMSCGQIALIESRIGFDKYYASEIDKHAISQTQLNFPSTTQLGNVTNWLLWDIDWKRIDLIFAGSPCQGFSFAGKQLAFNDPRSSLFFTFVDILRYAQRQNPNVRFLLENVQMKKEHLAVISHITGVPGKKIDAADISAQSRVRYYWTDIVKIPDPVKRDVALVDVLDRKVDFKYYLRLSDSIINDFIERCDPKLLIDLDVYAGAIRGRYDNANKVIQRIELRGRHKSNCLTTVTKDNIIVLEVLNLPGRYDIAKRVLSPLGKSATLTCDGNGGGLAKKIIDPENFQFRYLTPNEYSKLQCVPSWYVWDASKTQIYNMCGNGWNIEVIKHILQFL